ncbi:MAG TPA: hypothetical protein ENI59_01615 [Euryarchaeota archaeon]|nr:hypothetical protein [Euryarchaeota archaeon]
MLLLNKPRDEEINNPEIFGSTSQYIHDELELIHDQQENIIQVSEELEKALSQANKMKQLLKIVRKIEKIIMQKHIKEKKKKESRMINTMEEIKKLLKEKRYEDIDKLMLLIRHKSQGKIKLSQQELYQLRSMMENLVELYKEAAGLCRLYKLIYENVKKIYDESTEELRKETIEEEELSRAGSYKEHLG